MEKNLTCAQTISLLNCYIEDKLNSELKEGVTFHLQNCRSCRKKFNELKNIIKHNKNNFQKKVREYSINKELIANLSAYMDNELNSGDNIKIKKMTVSNPDTRRKLENMYKFQRLLHSAYEKTKTENKFDYSKNIISRLNNFPDYTTTLFNKIAIMFAIMFSAIIAGLVYLYM